MGFSQEFGVPVKGLIGAIQGFIGFRDEGFPKLGARTHN